MHSRIKCNFGTKLELIENHTKLFKELTLTYPNLIKKPLNNTLFHILLFVFILNSIAADTNYSSLGFSSRFPQKYKGKI